jgi:hypothetical protein
MGSGKHIQSSLENHGTVSKKEGQSSKEVQQSVSEKNGGADSGEVALDKENVNSDANHEVWIFQYTYVLLLNCLSFL